MVEGTLYVAGGTMYVSIVVGLGAVGAVCVVRTEVAAGCGARVISPNCGCRG